MRLLGFISIALPILSLQWLRPLTVLLDQYYMVSGKGHRIRPSVERTPLAAGFVKNDAA